MSGKKKVVRNIALALGMACIVLTAGIGEVIAYSTMRISSKDSQIACATEILNQLNAGFASQDKITALANVNTLNLIDEWNQLPTTDQPSRLLHSWLNEFRAFLNFLNQGQTPTMAQGSNDGLQLTITLQKTLFRLGEPIGVTLTMTNISNQTQEFVLGPGGNDFDFHVYNETDIDVYWHSSIWLEKAIPDVLIGITLNSTEPWGNSWSESFVWRQNMIASGTVSPGTYNIVGRYGPLYFYSRNSVIETTPIQITILPF